MEAIPTIMEKALFQIDRDNEVEFEKIFKMHFKGLHSYASTLVKDAIMAEEIVQNIFCKLWEKEDQIQIKESVAGYLYRSVYNEGLNYLKHLKVREAYHSYAMAQDKSVNQTGNQVEFQELEERLEKALNELPEKCRTIFQMSRFEELRYQEIADRLGLPVKAVENQMGKALKLLRIKLSDYLPASIILLLLTC